ncbi:MAG: 50S ribosomal protein L6 [Planctomycetaceae bacterium]
MSRIGKKPVAVPAGIDVAVAENTITVKGKGGELAYEFPAGMEVVWDAAARKIQVGRPDNARQNRAYHGLVRSLIQNMVQGLIAPFEKKLEIVGVGYQATLAGRVLKLQVGFANVVELVVPDVVVCEVPSTTQVVVRSIDKQACGQFAANVRRVRPPEPYKGKGIRYVGEQVRRKVGKANAGG